MMHAPTRFLRTHRTIFLLAILAVASAKCAFSGLTTSEEESPSETAEAAIEGTDAAIGSAPASPSGLSVN